MSPNPQLAAPGSSTYSSNTMYVGDGTWDSTRNSFLLPNLMGLNFATMRYNGMGNRFLSFTGYHRLILAHGVLAAIVFLGLVPAAILIARFYSRNPILALRLHIWLQSLAFLLSTVIIILGFFAVGPERHLTNPHHGIGVAIYVLVVFQLLLGWLMHRRERGRTRVHVPLKVMLHQWLGRAASLLGIAQIPLGLTLYGSPQTLFILYAVWGFILVLLYFILSYTHQRDIRDYDSRGSYLSESEVVDEEGRRRHSGLGRLAMAGAAGAGLAALWRRRSQSRRREDGHPDSEESYVEEEKYSDSSKHGTGHKLVKAGALGAGLAALTGLFKRRQHDDDSSTSYSTYSRPPLGGNETMTDASYAAVGQMAPVTPPRPVTPGRSPLAQPPMTPHHRTSHSSLSYDYDSYVSASPSRRGHHTIRNTIATAGILAGVRQLFKNRKQRREDRRAEEIRQHEIDQERIQRANSHGNLTGDGFVPRRHRQHGSQTASSISSFSNRPAGTTPVPPVGITTPGPVSAAGSALRDRDRIRPVGTDPVVAGSSGVPTSHVQPPPLTDHVGSSASDVYSADSGRPPRHRRNEAAAAMAGAALGAAAAGAAAHHSSRRRRSSQTGDGESPSASVKVKMHKDGDRITLRRLTEEERQRERQARREARRRRAGSISSASGTDATSAAGRRWRRTEARERREAEEIQAHQAAAAPAAAPSMSRPEMIAGPSTTIPPDYAIPPPPPGAPHAGPAGPRPPIPAGMVVPPPPPIPESSVGYPPGASSVTSPGETSASEYAANRRRRRAERAQAKLARQGKGGGPSVEFT